MPASTDWIPFDLGRPDLLHCLELYAQEEDNGGFIYAFRSPVDSGALNARSALDLYRQSGKSPLSMWQTHLFEYRGEGL